MTDDDARYEAYRPPAEPRTEPSTEPSTGPEAEAPGYQQYAVPPVATRAHPSPSSVITPGSTATVARLLTIGLAGMVVLVALAVTLLALRGTTSTVVATPSGGISADSSAIGGSLKQLRSRYSDALQHDDLPGVGLEDTRFNRLGVAAFTFFLTDMISAAELGVSDTEARAYAEDAARYERLLLAGTPLGDDIQITFDEHREFRYDGATGQGGYVDPTTAGPMQGSGQEAS